MIPCSEENEIEDDSPPTIQVISSPRSVKDGGEEYNKFSRHFNQHMRSSRIMKGGNSSRE
jgi:hypothetical protein